MIGQLSVSVVGLGTNQLGTPACDEATSTRVVHEALDAGIAYFDTADEYGRRYFDPTDTEGWGRAEEYLGRALGTLLQRKSGKRITLGRDVPFGGIPIVDGDKGWFATHRQADIQVA